MDRDRLIREANGDVATAWARLLETGVLPPSWRGATRRFIHDRGERPTRDPLRAPCGEHPASVEELAVFAADPEGVMAAEQAAAELAHRLAPWGAVPLQHVRWWCVSRAHYTSYASTDTRPGVDYSLMFAALAMDEVQPVTPAFLEDARPWTAAWQALARTAARIETPAGPRLFAELADPYEPLARVQATGHATLEWLGAAGAVVLVAFT